jgi:hypothetical protein
VLPREKMHRLLQLPEDVQRYFWMFFYSNTIIIELIRVFRDAEKDAELQHYYFYGDENDDFDRYEVF